MAARTIVGVLNLGIGRMMERFNSIGKIEVIREAKRERSATSFCLNSSKFCKGKDLYNSLRPRVSGFLKFSVASEV